MATTIALIGRANVGKSTLFNLLCQNKKAIVADYAGTTRDRQYGIVKRFVKNNFNVVDTGGIENNQDPTDIIENQIKVQTEIALQEAKVIFFMVDAKAGLTLGDEIIAKKLRQLKAEKDIYLLVNKSDGFDINVITSEFHKLALTKPIPISALTKLGIKTFMAQIDELYPNQDLDSEYQNEIKVAIIGKPNVGKSTLINRIIGENRLITSNLAGTSRDSIEVPFFDKNQHFSFIDTAGIRRRSKVSEDLEKLTIIKAMGAMQSADVVVFLLDGLENPSNQDMRLIELTLESHKPLLIVVNKCDGMDKNQLKELKKELIYQLKFIDWAEFQFISALKGIGTRKILDKVKFIYQKANIDFSTHELSEILHDLINSHPSPKVKNKRIKFRYAHQGGKNPPTIVLHGNHDESIMKSYENYLISGFRKAFRLTGVPILLKYKKSKNPYENKKNPLTEKQIQKKRRAKKIFK